MAQTYINAVSIDTKYDNTAFIIGLASILSQWHTGAIEQLRKINPKIPEIKIDTTPTGNMIYGNRKIWRVTEKQEKDGLETIYSSDECPDWAKGKFHED